MPPKKKKIKPSFDPSPVKRQNKRFCNYTDVTPTKVEQFAVVHFTRGDKPEGPYMKPIIDAFEEDTSGELSRKWQLIKICPCKGASNGDGTHAATPKAVGSKINWDGFVIYRVNESISWKDIGCNLAKKLTKFVKESRDYDTKIPFLFRQVAASETPHALGHYLFPKDVVGLLKRSYSDSDKDDIAEDGDILESFFGSAEEGKKIIASVAPSEWDAM